MPPTDTPKAPDDDFTFKDESFEWRGVYVSCIRITCKLCSENFYAAEPSWAWRLADRHTLEKHSNS